MFGEQLHVRRDRQPPAETFAELMTQVRQLTESARHETLFEDCSRLGVEVDEGEGRLSSPWMVEVESRTLTTRYSLSYAIQRATFATSNPESQQGTNAGQADITAGAEDADQHGCTCAFRRQPPARWRSCQNPA